MSDHIKQQVVQEFFAKRSHSPGKWQDWILLFYQSGRRSNYIENMSHILSRGTMAHCFKLLYNVSTGQPTEQPQTGSNPAATVNQFLIF